MTIYHVNFADKTCKGVGHVSLPQDSPMVYMIIEFKPKEDGGTVTICNTNLVWSYAVREAITAATVYDRSINRYKGRKVTLSGDIENIVITIVLEDDKTFPSIS